jgi:hypothetical protein
MALTRLFPGTVNLVARLFSRRTTPAFLRHRPNLCLSSLSTAYSTENRAQQSDDIDEEDEEVLRFHEEFIGLPASSGFGYMHVDIGDEIGEQGRYKILRKLGYGMYSTVWLARDAWYACQLPLLGFGVHYPWHSGLPQRIDHSTSL